MGPPAKTDCCPDDDELVVAEFDVSVIEPPDPPLLFASPGWTLMPFVESSLMPPAPLLATATVPPAPPWGPPLAESVPCMPLPFGLPMSKGSVLLDARAIAPPGPPPRPFASRSPVIKSVPCVACCVWDCAVAAARVMLAPAPLPWGSALMPEVFTVRLPPAWTLMVPPLPPALPPVAWRLIPPLVAPVVPMNSALVAAVLCRVIDPPTPPPAPSALSCSMPVLGKTVIESPVRAMLPPLDWAVPDPAPSAFRVTAESSNGPALEERAIEPPSAVFVSDTEPPLPWVKPLAAVRLPVMPFGGVVADREFGDRPTVNGVELSLAMLIEPPLPVPVVELVAAGPLAVTEPYIKTVCPLTASWPPLPLPTASRCRLPKRFTAPLAATSVSCPPLPSPSGLSEMLPVLFT